MEDDLVESECARHGLDRHVHVHEAGHAVSALDHGVPFVSVELFGEEGGPKFDGGLRHAAALVDPGVETAREWVLPDPVAALRFVLGGALAEIALLDHALDGGFLEDLRVWRRGLGLTEALPLEMLDQRLGIPFNQIRAEVEDWASANARRIESVAQHLATLSPPGSISFDEVKGIADRAETSL